MEDARIIKTRKYLKEALLSLLSTSNLSDINVARLCNKAEINRSTFYAHYKNVLELYEEIVNKYNDTVCNYIYKIYTTRNENTDHVVDFIKYTEKNSELFMFIFKNSNSMEKNNPSYKRLENVFKEKYKGINLNPSYIINYFIYAGGSILYTWIKNGKKEKIDDVAFIMRKMVLNGPVSFLK